MLTNIMPIWSGSPSAPSESPATGTWDHVTMGVPDAALGVDGETALDASSVDGSWYHKVGGAWVRRGSLRGATGPVGPAGAAGPTGPQGLVGPAGPKGDAGAAGAAGPAGAPGLAGPAGPKGDAGAVGAAGPAGPQGLAGPAGPRGDAGPAGPKGDVGAVGPAGPVGPQGSTGPAGPKGDAGAVGPAGPAGPQGLAGAAGPKGDAGGVGPAGPAGQGLAARDAGAVGPAVPQGWPQGDAGPAGPAGPQGAIGPAGPKGDPGATLQLIERTADLAHSSVLPLVVLPPRTWVQSVVARVEAAADATAVDIRLLDDGAPIAFENSPEFVAPVLASDQIGALVAWPSFMSMDGGELSLEVISSGGATGSLRCMVVLGELHTAG
jgi:hypothetical protein